MKTIHWTLLGAALVAALGACESATGPGAEDGPVMEVAARGEDAPAASVSPDGGAPRFTHTASRGSVEFRARVYVRSSAGGWAELTDGAFQRASVDAGGHGSSQIFAGSRVEAGTYDRVRMVFDEVNADITASVTVGGASLTGNVSVATGDSLVVERTIQAQASAGFTTQLLLNLNADAWLSRVNLATRTVSAADFASAIGVEVR
ncbi:MAG TPA: hypothetical protein VFQ39_12590 [Longimicrobium sp.]|nr:hypothetical protein [Longimicrobium sp.]